MDKKIEAVFGSSKRPINQGLSDDILIHRRGFFIRNVKAPLVKNLVKFASNKTSWIGSIFALIGIIKLCKKYPEPKKENTVKPNTHALIDIWDEFFEYEVNNPHTDALFRALRRLSLGEYEHDPYYANRIDWFIEKLAEKYLSGEWKPREAYAPTGFWREPSVLEGQRQLKNSLLERVGLSPDTPVKAFDRFRE